MVEVTQDRLKALYLYDKVTGIFTSKLYGKSVGFAHRGYLAVKLWHNGKERKFKLHQLAWLYVNGKWPSSMLDHKNGIKTDNRIENLREVTSKQNAENRGLYKTSSGLPRSGYKGVHWVRANNKWRSSIGHNGQVIYLGLFDDPAEASAAYVKAAQSLHTHNEQAQ